MNSKLISYSFICIILLLLSFSKRIKADNQTNLEMAEKSYSKGNFENAIKLYLEIINSNYESPEVYYNLGNAYLKTNKIGLAIVYYEKAKKLSPNDEDILFNLKVANKRTVDKIEPLPELFIKEWQNTFLLFFTEKQWSLFFIILFALSLICFWIYKTSSSIVNKQIGFYGFVVLILLSTLLFYISFTSYQHSKNNTNAIIVVNAVTAKGSPDENGTKLFILHEGTKVSVTETSNNWSEIRIANGNVGWINNSALVKI